MAYRRVSAFAIFSASSWPARGAVAGRSDRATENAAGPKCADGSSLATDLGVARPVRVVGWTWTRPRRGARSPPESRSARSGREGAATDGYLAPDETGLEIDRKIDEARGALAGESELRRNAWSNQICR